MPDALKRMIQKGTYIKKVHMLCQGINDKSSSQYKIKEKA
jgi:hypothetical protein